MNKKGAETTIATIVVVILSILVLVVVAAGFTMGWAKLWEKLNVWAPKAASPDAVIAKCDGLCLSSSKYSYCCAKQEVEINEETVKDKSCDQLKNSEDAKYKLPITCETIDCAGVCPS